MPNFTKVYGFSNENLTALSEIYEFKNQRVLTVLGSGDQYFTSILNGAKKVDVFDINMLTWYYFVLKFMAIRHLTYEEFYQFSVIKKLDNLETYQKLRKFLPEDIRMYFDFLVASNKEFSSNIHSNISFKIPGPDDGSLIPYFSKQKYYELQTLLQRVDLPEFFNVDILDLSTNSYYDLMLFSNIYHYIAYMPLSLQKYRTFLDKFKCPNIEALYDWTITEEEKNEFLGKGFEIDYVSTTVKSVNYSKDAILSLRR